MNHDISNGRSELLKTVLNDYDFSDYFFGVGIGGYASTHLGEYTHNIFTCTLLECGCIGLIYIVYRCLAFIRRIVGERDNMMIFLFSISFVPLFFSNIFWCSFPFWVFIFYYPLNKINKE